MQFNSVYFLSQHITIIAADVVINGNSGFKGGDPEGMKIPANRAI